MILVALLLPVFCHSQSNKKHVTTVNEEHVTNLEERLATLEVYVLEIVSLVNKNKEAINAAMETTENSTCKLVGGVTLASLCGFIVLCKLYCRPLLP